MVVSYSDPASAVFTATHQDADTLSNVVHRKKTGLARLLLCFNKASKPYERLGWAW